MLIPVLLITFLAAGAVLLICLRGFSQARRHQKVQGLLVRVHAIPAGSPNRRRNKCIDFASHCGWTGHTTFDEGQISKKTIALIGLAILLGSRGGGVEQFQAPVTPGSDGNTQAGKHLHVPGRQLLRGS